MSNLSFPSKFLYFSPLGGFTHITTGCIYRLETKDFPNMCEQNNRALCHAHPLPLAPDGDHEQTKSHGRGSPAQFRVGEMQNTNSAIDRQI
jgi:hypothetical protein